MSYKTLKAQYIQGEWKDGSSGRTMENTNPYNGEIIATCHAASLQDLDDAYQSANRVQKKWTKTNPVVQREVFEKAVVYMEENHEAIVAIIIEEIGGTKLKAEFEIG